MKERLHRAQFLTFSYNKNIDNFLVRGAFQTSDQTRTFTCERPQCKTYPCIRNVEKVSGPKRSVKITHHFSCTPANVIYCITCTICKKIYIGEKGRRLGDRFRDHVILVVGKDDKNASKPVARPLISPIILSNIWESAAFPYIKEARKAAKLWDRNLFFKPALLILAVSTNALLFCCFSRNQAPTNSVAPSFCI